MRRRVVFCHTSNFTSTRPHPKDARIKPSTSLLSSLPSLPANVPQATREFSSSLTQASRMASET